MPVYTTTPLSEARPEISAAPGFPILRNHRTHNTVPINGWKSVLLGLPFVATGTLLGLVALDRIPARKHAPGWLIGAAAGLFVAGGSVFLVHGLCGLYRRAGYWRKTAVRPDEPWLADYPWRREGIGFSEVDEMLRRLLAALGWTVILSLLAWVGMRQPDGWPIWAALCLFSLCCLMLWSRWAASVFELGRYGDTYLHFGEFPFRLGAKLRARLRAPRHMAAIEQLTITLRCVQEHHSTEGDGTSRTMIVVCYEMYKDAIQLNADRLAGLGGSDVPIEFCLPKRQAATNLSATAPTYWEIEVNGKARGADYAAVFLVPVYNAR
ncbi:MAG: hypothetical protein ACRD4R_05165 [Candidatus Acidiferrales bacterium]